MEDTKESTSTSSSLDGFSSSVDFGSSFGGFGGSSWDVKSDINKSDFSGVSNISFGSGLSNALSDSSGPSSDRGLSLYGGNGGNGETKDVAPQDTITQKDEAEEKAEDKISLVDSAFGKVEEKSNNISAIDSIFVDNANFNVENQSLFENNKNSLRSMNINGTTGADSFKVGEKIDTVAELEKKDADYKTQAADLADEANNIDIQLQTANKDLDKAKNELAKNEKTLSDLYRQKDEAILTIDRSKEDIETLNKIKDSVGVLGLNKEGKELLSKIAGQDYTKGSLNKTQVNNIIDITLSQKEDAIKSAETARTEAMSKVGTLEARQYSLESNINEYEKSISNLTSQKTNIESRINALIVETANNTKALEKARETGVMSDTLTANIEEPVENTIVEEPAPTMTEPTSFLTQDIRDNLIDYLGEEKGQAAIQVFENLEASRNELQSMSDKLINGVATSAEIVAYVDALDRFNTNLKAANSIGNNLTRTNFNKEYTRAVVQAANFKVNDGKGGEQDFGTFVGNMATKSPQIAQAIYEQKAAKTDSPMLSKVYSALAKGQNNWFGSKLGFQDNKVRNQFTQTAELIMKATANAYNNVLNNPNATNEQKEEAAGAIGMAKGMMSMATALKASTGFFSGMGDSLKDGQYGVVNKKELNTSQKIMNGIKNGAQIILGLGVTPAANKAYQDMYYMNPNNKLLSWDPDKDGLPLTVEYGNNAAASVIGATAELVSGVAMLFSPVTASSGMNLILDAVKNFGNGVYGIQKDAEKLSRLTDSIVAVFDEAKKVEGLSPEAMTFLDDNLTKEKLEQITKVEEYTETFKDRNDWLEGTGSNTADNGKFNQALTYDEWQSLINSDPAMKDFALSLNR